MKYVLIFLFTFGFVPGYAQPKDNLRARLSVMVLPYTSAGEDIQSKLDKDEGYKNAISTINNTLIAMGYTKTIDFKTYRENVDNKNLMDEGKSWSEKIKTYIENAPADLVIETEITWIDPPGNPRDRRARLHLKAVDKYTSAIYADNSRIASAPREFPDLSAAVEAALLRDGNAQFRSFLDQLDSSYANLLRYGRQVSIQFGVGRETTERFSDLVDNERLSDKVEEYVRQKAYQGQYTILGESGAYMQFSVYVPIVDGNGVSQTPSWFLRREIDAYFRRWGFAIDYSVVGNWINFLLLKKSVASATYP